MKRLVLLLILLAAPAALAQVTVLAGGRLIDGYGGPPIENAVIVIDGTTIRTVGTQTTVRIPDGAKIIDTNGYTVMPGLMDMHVHLMILGHGDYDHWFKTYASQWRDVVMPISAKELLFAGVTTPRHLGAPLDDIIAVTKKIEEGHVPSPRR